MKKCVLQIIKVMVVDVIITLLAVLLLSFLLYKFKLGESVMRTGIVMVYVVSNFIGGFFIGRIKENKKYMWGAFTGVAYFVLLTLISVIVTGELFGNGSMALIAFVASVIAGTIGGMLS